MSGPAIRDAQPGDVEALLRIEEAAFRSDRLTRRNFRHAVRSPSLLALVAERGGAVIGYALVETRRTTRVARLSSVAVAPEAGKRGLGRRLLDAAEEAARSRGCGRLRLEVRADNARAIALYTRAGYRRTGCEPDYYEDGETALGFEKTLLPAGGDATRVVSHPSSDLRSREGHLLPQGEKEDAETPTPLLPLREKVARRSRDG